MIGAWSDRFVANQSVKLPNPHDARRADVLVCA